MPEAVVFKALGLGNWMWHLSFKPYQPSNPVDRLGYKDGPLLHVAAATSASCCSVTGLGNLVWRTRMQKSVRVRARTQPSIVLEVLTMLS